MDDYLSAIDDVSKESYVDKTALGCVGAVMVDIRHLFMEYTTIFKTFDDVFNTRHVWTFSSAWDFGGLGKDNATAQNLYYIQPY
jgi:hypothetical protein